MTISRLRLADRGGRCLDAAPEAQVVAQHQGGAGAPRPAGVAWRWPRMRSHVGAGLGGVAAPRAARRDVVVPGLARRPASAATAASSCRALSATSGPVTRTAKSKRGLSSAP